MIGGPVRIPHVYNGKDKTFFLFGVEEYRENAPMVTLTSVPSVAERSGDFSGAGLNIYDPFSAQANPNFNASSPVTASNPQYIRTQFPDNVIPQSLWNPAGLGVIKSYPQPNFGGPGMVSNNYLVSPNISQDRFRNNWIGRVDQSVGQKEKLFSVTRITAVINSITQRTDSRFQEWTRRTR